MLDQGGAETYLKQCITLQFSALQSGTRIPIIATTLTEFLL
jgi:hypothetical protein